MVIEKELYEKVSDLTLTDYEPHKTDNEEMVFVTSECLVNMIEDLIVEIDCRLEQIEDLVEDIENNYIHKPVED